jgi:hypothetical protein
MSRRVDPVCRLLSLSLLTLLSGCFSPTPAEDVASHLPVLAIIPDLRLELSSPVAGPATLVRAAVVLAGDGVSPLTIGPALSRSAGGSGSVLDLRLRWEDHPGDRPVARGHQTQKLVPWEHFGEASPQRPLVVYVEVPLEAPTGVLARRVTVWGRLIGVDLVGAEGRSGGTVLELPPATLETLAFGPGDQPVQPLAQHLESGHGPGIFLSAVTAPAESRMQVLDTLIEALPRIGKQARDAAFAALLYLTGETHGYDIHRWRTWWAEHRQMQDGR